jgi:hypothetical protein
MAKALGGAGEGCTGSHRILALAAGLLCALVTACASVQGDGAAGQDGMGQLKVRLGGASSLTTIVVRNVFDHSKVYLVDCAQKDHLLNGASFCDELLILPPGAYELIVQSQDPSCRSEQDHYKVLVKERQTVEVQLTLICGGNTGGLDVLVTTRHRPQLTGIVFTFDETGQRANKFICQECTGENGDVWVEVQVTDSDTACHLLTPTWSATDAAGLEVTSALIVATVAEAGPAGTGLCLFRARLDAGRPLGSYLVTFAVSDGSPPSTAITFPVHIIDCGCELGIRIVKYTNGVDANLPPGPLARTGSAVYWTYVVTNRGSEPLTSVTVTDSMGVVVTCPKSTLAAGESMTCKAAGIAASGQYSNLGTVTGNPPSGPPVTDTDPSHYFGEAPAITLVKLTNGQDGAYLAAGTAITWTYDVTNVGNVPLKHVTVTDDQPGVVVSCPKSTLAVGEFMRCTAMGVAEPGLYENVGTARGLSPTEWEVTATDPSSYFGTVNFPAIHLVKLTNGQDGAQLLEGTPITWTYDVTNIGTVTLTQVTVTDDQPGVTVWCPTTTLLPSQTMRCTAEGIAILGSYVNLGTATGMPPTGPQVTSSDPSSYFGLPHAQVCLVILDEDAVDEGMTSVEAAATACGVTPGQLINDPDTVGDALLPSDSRCLSRNLDASNTGPFECGNPPLRWNRLVAAGGCGPASGVGRLPLMPTGQVSDVGWYAPPPPFLSAGSKVIRYADTRPPECDRYSTPGQRASILDGVARDGYDLWLEEYSAGVVWQSCLDKVRDVMPLRNQDLVQFVGKTCTAIVYDSDVSINYQPLQANLQGRRNGKFTFKVDSLEVPGNGTLPESASSTSLYALWLQVLAPAEPTAPWRAKLSDHGPDSIQVTSVSFVAGTLVVEGTSNHAGPCSSASSCMQDDTPPYLQDPYRNPGAFPVSLPACTLPGQTGCTVYDTPLLPTPEAPGDDLAYMTVSVDNSDHPPVPGDASHDPTVREVQLRRVPGTANRFRATVQVPAGVNLAGRRLVIQTDEGGAYNVRVP